MPLRHLACLALVLALLAPASLADEELDDGKLVVRFFDVGALTMGIVDYIPEAMGLCSPDMVSDENNPLFGHEGECPRLPVGMVDEVIELIKNNVEPEYWNVTMGVDMRCIGERTIIVRAARSVVAKVARFLADLEADILTTVTLDVRAVRVPAGMEAGLEELLALDGLSLTVSSLVGQHATAWVGTQFAYVQDYDVAVAQEANISDPIVGVANWGLCVSARTVAAPGAVRLRTMLDAALAIPSGRREHTTDEKRIIELPTYETVSARTELLLKPGEWQVAQDNAGGSSADRWVFLVRGTATRGIARSAADDTLLDPSVPADAGPLVSRRFDVSDLIEPPRERRGWGIYLVPSNFTPPEPPELAEPAPILPGETLFDLLQEFVVPESWERDGTSIDLRYGLLFVTNTESVLARVEALLAFLRSRHLWTIEMDARLLDVPVAVGRGLLEAANGAPHLLDDVRQALLARAIADGSARQTDRVLVTSLFGTRNTVRSGERFSYVQDFEVEIAEKSTVSNPVVMFGTEGVEVDLCPMPTSTGDAVNLAFQVTRTQLDGDRQVSTPHGPIDTPALDIFRIRGNLRAPLGETAVVGAGGEGKRMFVLLVTPVLKPYGR